MEITIDDGMDGTTPSLEALPVLELRVRHGGPWGRPALEKRAMLSGFYLSGTFQRLPMHMWARTWAHQRVGAIR